MLKSYLLSLALLASGCALSPAHSQPHTSPPTCSLPEADREWIDRALEAWRFAAREITGNVQLPHSQAIFFSADCVLSSENALSSTRAGDVRWSASPHAGEVTLPDGKKIPSGVTSFASGEKGSYYFVMSTPSVWEAGGVGQGESLRKTMVAVLLHESSHIAQIRAYGTRLEALIDRYSLPDSFNDDSLQERFGKNPEFTASIKRETQLFLDAAATKDDAEARRLAREGLGLVRERQARWLVGDDAYLVEAEDLWLTFEGAGQWVAYQWLVDPRGGRASREEEMVRFSGNRWWSQAEGFAVVMALDRIAGPGWKGHAYGDGAQTVLEMLEAAVRD
ncbi:MAG: hypothetical protein ABI718_03320 [Acidobacteriota bacterium]